MKKSTKTIVQICPFIFILALMGGCGGGEGNTGAKVTEIDSAEDRRVIQEINGDSHSGDFNPGSSVQVDITEHPNFDWVEFRSQLQAAPEAIGEGFHLGDNEVTTAWKPYNDNYSYQTRYLYKDDQLWLQTYYRQNSGESQGTSSNAEGKILTRETNEPGLQNLWKEMEDLANEVKSSLE